MIWYLQISLVSLVSPSSAIVTIHFGLCTCLYRSRCRLAFVVWFVLRSLVCFVFRFSFSFRLGVRFLRSAVSRSLVRSFVRSFVSFVCASPPFVRFVLVGSFLSTCTNQVNSESVMLEFPNAVFIVNDLSVRQKVSNSFNLV